MPDNLQNVGDFFGNTSPAPESTSENSGGYYAEMVIPAREDSQTPQKEGTEITKPKVEVAENLNKETPVQDAQKTEPQKEGINKESEKQPASDNVIESYFTTDGKFDSNAAIELIKKQPVTESPVAQPPIPVKTEEKPPQKMEWEIQKDYMSYAVDSIQDFIRQGYAPEKALEFTRNALEAYCNNQKQEFERKQEYQKLRDELTSRKKEIDMEAASTRAQQAYVNNMSKLASQYNFKSVTDFEKILLNPDYGSGKVVMALFEKLNPEFKNKNGKEYQQAISMWFPTMANDPELSFIFGEIAHAKIVSAAQRAIIRKAQTEQEKISKLNSQQPIQKSQVMTHNKTKELSPEQKDAQKLKRFFGFGDNVQSIN